MKKIISLTLSLLMALSLIACAAKTNTEANVETNQAEEKGTLILCTNAEFPPYEYVDNGNYVGIDIDLAKEIGKKLNMNVEVMDVAFDSIIPAVKSGKADFAMAGMTVTEDRLQNVNFSHTYQTAIQNIIIKEGSSIKSLDDLADKLIGVASGFTADIYATDDFGDEHVERFKNAFDAVESLKAGKIDCVMMDDQVAVNLVKANAGLTILDTPYAEEEYAAAVAKDNTELLDKLNKTIDELKADGTLKKIVSKYITE